MGTNGAVPGTMPASENTSGVQGVGGGVKGDRPITPVLVVDDRVARRKPRSWWETNRPDEQCDQWCAYEINAF